MEVNYKKEKIMANYSLVINSRFRPFEYQELLAPVLAATQAHQTLEESYGQLQAQASTIEAMANEQNDPESYKAYKDYADSLKVQADDLAMNGLNLASRKALFDMRNRYTQEIMPIQEAYNRRLADIKAQAETMLKDPTHLFDRRARDISLDEYRNNPNLDVLSSNYSKALLAQQVAQGAANLKGTILDAASKGKLTSLGLPYQYERQLQRGASVDEVLQAMSKDPKALPILTGIVESVMASSGIRNWSSMNGDWANNPVYKEAEQAAMQGLYSAIGNTEVKEFTDTFNMNNDLEIRKEERAARAAASAAEAEATEPSRGWNFLETNGDLAAYNNIQSNITLKGGALKASYFGKKFVNPIKVYEEATAAYNKALKKYTYAGKTLENSPALWRDNIEASDYAKKARDKVLKSYGVTQILSSKEYNRLKELGYTNKSTFNDFRNDYSRRVNERASQWRHESVNLNETALQERGNTLKGYLGYLEDYDKWNGQVYLMAANGTKGKAVKELDDIGLDKESLKKANLTDVFYSRQAPDMIHSQFGGVEIYVNPNAYGAEAAAIVREASSLLAMKDAQLKKIVSNKYGLNPEDFTAEQARDFIAKDTTAKLRDIMRGYGKGRGNTDSEI